MYCTRIAVYPHWTQQLAYVGSQCLRASGCPSGITDVRGRWLSAWPRRWSSCAIAPRYFLNIFSVSIAKEVPRQHIIYEDLKSRPSPPQIWPIGSNSDHEILVTRTHNESVFFSYGHVQNSQEDFWLMASYRPISHYEMKIMKEAYFPATLFNFQFYMF